MQLISMSVHCPKDTSADVSCENSSISYKGVSLCLLMHKLKVLHKTREITL